MKIDMFLGFFHDEEVEEEDEEMEKLISVVGSP